MALRSLPSSLFRRHLHSNPRQSPTTTAQYHDYIRFATPGTFLLYTTLERTSFDPLIKSGGTARIPLHSPKVIGVSTSRGNRRQVRPSAPDPHPFPLFINNLISKLLYISSQEDFHSYAALSLDPEELRLSLKKAHHIDWDPTSFPPPLARQVLFVGIYDGHGGSTVSQFLRQELHGRFESADKSQVPELYEWATKDLDGYFKRFKGGALAPWVSPNAEGAKQELDLEARSTLAFFEVSLIYHLAIPKLR